MRDKTPRPSRRRRLMMMKQEAMSQQADVNSINILSFAEEPSDEQPIETFTVDIEAPKKLGFWSLVVKRVKRFLKQLITI